MSPALPEWLKKQTPKGQPERIFRSNLDNERISTVCQEARCPNRGECFSAGRTTFLILGKTCTRHCTFCAVAKGRPEPVDQGEPEAVGAAVKKLRLKYVVITSVTRDDLPDGGAAHFARTIEIIKEKNPGVKIEVLTPDFAGNIKALEKVLAAAPFVFNHNLETVPRLYPQVRPQADFNRSLKILAAAKKIAPGILTKSGLMLGLGETIKELTGVMKKLVAARVDFLTLGQYLQPSSGHVKIRQYISPETFSELALLGKGLGFKRVLAGPWVRSSYLAEEIINNI